MRIIGTGIDLAEIERVGSLLAKYPRFAERCFTEHEREYAFRFAKPERRLAARFAGKEAVMKSMGTGWRRIRWRDIEITGGGKPTVRISGTAQKRAEMLGVTGFEITITFSAGYWLLSTDYSSLWQTASMLFPSGSNTNAP
jgi:holo-[acyl-carrier protein] synthase